MNLGKLGEMGVRGGGQGAGGNIMLCSTAPIFHREVDQNMRDAVNNRDGLGLGPICIELPVFRLLGFVSRDRGRFSKNCVALDRSHHCIDH
jgi:hypothetical protein